MEISPTSNLSSCEFNVGSRCVDFCYSDGTMLSIDRATVETHIEMIMNGRAEMDVALDYAQLVLSRELEGYLKRVSDPYSGIGWDHKTISKVSHL
jgi:hypothetical protein